MYFVRGSEAAVDAVAADAGKGLYDTMHLNFAPGLPPPLLERLAGGLVSGGAAHRVAKVGGENLRMFVMLFSKPLECAGGLKQPQAGMCLTLRDTGEATGQCGSCTHSMPLQQWRCGAQRALLALYRCSISTWPSARWSRGCSRWRSRAATWR